METVRAAVIGIGNMGSAHASCIARHQISGMELAAVCDIRPERTEHIKAEFPSVRTYQSWEELIAAADIDAVIIAVPHPLHSLIAAAALRNGKHVLTEKPADVSVSAALEVHKAAAESGKVFAIMFNQRTNELFRRARQIVSTGQLGQLKRSVWIVTNWYRTQHYYDSGDWRATWSGEGGGVLLNQAPHNLDLWQWICGMPNQITAFCDVAKYHQIQVEDDVTIFARYPDGATGTFITSTGEYPGTNRLEICGTLGKLVLENGTLKWWRLLQSEREVCRDCPENSPKIESDYREYRQAGPDSAHAGILQNFTNAILFGEELISPGTEGIRELTISNAAYLSSWCGGIPIDLPLDNAEFDRRLEQLRRDSARKDAASDSRYNTSYASRWKVNW